MKKIALIYTLLTVICINVFCIQSPPEKPRIWVLSDYGYNTDKDDQVVMSVLLFWANEFRIEGLVPGAHKKNVRGLDLWNDQHKPGYKNDYAKLQACYQNFPTPEYINSVTYKCSTADGKGYRSISDLSKFPSVKAMIEAAREGSESDPLYVLLWGPQGDAATAVDWLLKNEAATLKKMIFISHASLPNNKYNCERDAKACSKMHDWAKEGKIIFIECGDSGQKGVHKHEDGRKCETFVKSKSNSIGTYMNKKWNNGYPDWSDGASFLCLMKQFGVDFTKLKTDGTNNTSYLTPIFKSYRAQMYDLIEERASVAYQNKCNATLINHFEEDKVLVFHNSALMQISISGDYLEQTEIKLIDIMGRTIYRSIPTGNNHIIYTEALKNGIYLISIKHRNGIINNYKILKN